jgi:hypothetical protein
MKRLRQLRLYDHIRHEAAEEMGEIVGGRHVERNLLCLASGARDSGRKKERRQYMARFREQVTCDVDREDRLATLLDVLDQLR